MRIIYPPLFAEIELFHEIDTIVNPERNSGIVKLFLFYLLEFDVIKSKFLIGKELNFIQQPRQIFEYYKMGQITRK